MKENKKIKLNLLEILLWIIAAIHIFPIYMVITIALKTSKEFAVNTYGLPKKIELENLVTAWTKMNMPAVAFNSIIIVALSIIVTVFVTSLASYAIARGRSKINNIFYILFISGMMIPFQLVMIPLYSIMQKLHLNNTYSGVIFIYTGLFTGFAVLVFTGFIKSIPVEIDEAAIIDGCNKVRIFFSMILPFLRAAIATVVVFISVWIWNDLLMPLLLLGGDKRTIITSLYNFQGTKYTVNWTMVFAGSLITMSPLVIVFLFSQKYFIKGMIAGAVKG